MPDNYFSLMGIVGRVYEYFLGKFAATEGKGGGECYTPMCVVNLIAEMIQPYSGKIYDPCCGSDGMFVQSVKFITSHSGNQKDISILGQEQTATTYKLTKMNLAIRGISATLAISGRTDRRSALERFRSWTRQSSGIASESPIVDRRSPEVWRLRLLGSARFLQKCDHRRHRRQQFCVNARSICRRGSAGRRRHCV